MTTPAPRPRPSLSQSMILVAAISLGLAWVRARSYNLEMLHRSFGSSMYYPDELISATGRFGRCWVVAKEWLPCLATLSIAIAVLGTLSMRPRLGRLSRRPGLVACVAATTVLIAEASRACVETFRQIVDAGWKLEVHGHHRRFVWSEELVPTVLAGEVAIGIAAAWAVLKLGGRWRRGPDWMDRLGLVTGWLWLACGLIEAVGPWSFVLR